MSGREVSLVLCTAGGALLGTADPFTVANPWVAQGGTRART